MSISHDVIQIHTGKCYKKIPEKMSFKKEFNDRTNKGRYQLEENGSIFFFNICCFMPRSVYDLSSE